MTNPEIIPTPLADHYIDCLRPVEISRWQRLKNWILRRKSDNIWGEDHMEDSDFVKFLKKSNRERKVMDMAESNSERRKKEGNKDIEVSGIGCLYYHEVCDETLICTKCGRKFLKVFPRDI